MQAEAERNLTRAFLWHETQSAQGQGGSPEEIAKLEQAIAALEAMGMELPATMLDSLAALKAAQTAVPGVKWQQAVADLAAQPELSLFLREVWKDRGDEFLNRTEDLAQILLMREIMRRPTRQNNAETMGLARLAFPNLEQVALNRPLPASLQGRGVTPSDYLGLVLSAVDLFFREKMVVALQPAHHMRWIAPKWGRLRQACSNDVAAEDRLDALPFPSALVGPRQRMHRVALNALALTGGSRDNETDLEEADALLREVYQLIVKHACKVWSQHAVALDFDKARLEPYRQAFACPLSRRIFAYAIKGGSPLNPSRLMQQVTFPAAPLAQRGGLTADERAQLTDWLAQDPAIARLKEQGHWTGLHNRAVLYGPYMRAQEHSAQLPRSQLKDYEADFNTGRINLLACSTTMEMGVDLSNVGLVVNSNVPPSVANYRQRVGRAGRRREPWAFGVTWCRDMPLDNKIFEDPRRLLQGRMAPPQVTLNSPILIQRHVNAAAFAGWLRQQGGIGILDKTGPFFGMDAQGKVMPDAAVDRFLAALTGPEAETLLPHPDVLLRGSVLTQLAPRDLAARVAAEMQRIVQRWRGEYRALVQRRDAAGEKDVSQALDALAGNMHGAFLLSDLSKEGFTPAYGYPSDVVCFDHIGGGKGRQDTARDEYLGRAGASRTLDVALREYAPGADIVINSLVYTSEGIRPAWSTQASASHLEDLRRLYQCPTCGKPHLSRDLPETCGCGAEVQPLQARKTLRPVGFVGRSEPHIGYELLRTTTFRMPEISADEAGFTEMPGDAGFRLRATPKGQVISRGSGEMDQGYAICLVCGRAAAEQAMGGPLPPGMAGHRPLVTGDRSSVVSGRCIGGDGAGRIQRNVHLVHDRATDVFELQMPQEVTPGAAFAFVASLREALAAWLGVETNEMGLAVRPSRGADQTRRVSAFVFDLAAGGAGLALRLGETGRLAALAADVLDRLTCREACEQGCPACILRPDMNMAQILPDRPAGAELARRLRDLLALDPRRRVFGPDSHAASQPLFDLISQHVTQGAALSVTLFARGAPGSWDLPEWPVSAALAAWRQQLPVEVVFGTDALQDPQMDVPTRLHLMRIAGRRGLAHAAELPMPVLAAIQTTDGLIGVAAAAPDEARPDGDWGAGKAGLLVCGPMEQLSDWSFLPAEALLPAGQPGKSAYSIMGTRLNTAASRFGRAFWSLVAEDAPALHDLLAREGVAEMRYDDRYVVKPLHFKLLRELFLALPGRDDATTLRLYTMASDPSDAPSTIDHTLATDDDREALFDQVLPGERLFIGTRAQTEHARFVTLTTRSGSKAMIYLDQGFDLWRLTQRVPISYGRDMEKLALQLERLDAQLVSRMPHLPAMFLCVI